MVVKLSGRTRSFFSLLLAATAVQWTGLMVVSTPEAIAQTTIKSEILLEPSEEESYKVFIARAEANAAVRVQSLFDQDLLRTEAQVTVLGQRSAAIAPVLKLRVSRREWTTYPDPEIWSVYYPESKSLLLFDEALPIVEAEPDITADEPLDDRLALFVTNPDTGNRYLLTGIGTWAEAQSEAAALGGSLVVINDQAEQNWLLDVFGDGLVPSSGLVNNQPQPTAGFWIGLSDIATEGEFVWINGDPVTYTNFAFAEPNNLSPEGLEEDYGAIALGGTLGSGGVWTDQSQDRVQLRGIVEVSAEATFPEDLDVPAVDPQEPAPSGVEPTPEAVDGEPEADGETSETTDAETSEAMEETTTEEATTTEPEEEDDDDDNGLPSRTVPTLVR
ncbi:C-type lectin domain-containing protein [[Limnothrix rosea] IAM M-220]|uniref:C-type lectin domain-containing protein n=1 Tax=[Limnothrix rosea] IAM M-220 TaxID=454133 RepID=UPI0009590C07|nr:C-type lectin domain-containing protein [[Limnothrix rosea] IAM M-220]OKH19051.1 hypothetical protein NIES208_03530 [[Limnothrix rosea] IAM M-220]